MDEVEHHAALAKLQLDLHLTMPTILLYKVQQFFQKTVWMHKAFLRSAPEWQSKEKKNSKPLIRRFTELSNLKTKKKKNYIETLQSIYSLGTTVPFLTKRWRKKRRLRIFKFLFFLWNWKNWQKPKCKYQEIKAVKNKWRKVSETSLICFRISHSCIRKNFYAVQNVPSFLRTFVYQFQHWKCLEIIWIVSTINFFFWVKKQ